MPDIPFPQAPERPQFQQSNPFQTMEALQGMALRGIEAQKAQQAAEQQGLVNKAQVGLGQIMQQHVNPQTGEVDINNVLADAAAHPDTAVLFPKIASDALNMKLTSQQLLNARIDGAMKKQEIMANTAASYLDKEARTGTPLNKQDLAGIYGEMVTSGVLSTDDAVKGLAFASSQKMSPAQLIRNMAMRSKQGIETMKSSMQTLDEQYALQQGVTAEGQPFQAPRISIPGRLPPGVGMQGSPAVGERNVEAGGSAPPGPAPARGQAQPSGSVPTSSGMVPTGMAPAQQKYQEGQQEAFLKAEDQINKNLTGAQAIQMRIDETVKALKDFKTGPGTPTFMKMAALAKAAGMDDVADRIMGGGKGAFAAAQEFEKLMVPHSMELLRQTLGGQGRITNLEFEKFAAANPNLETDPKALEKIFNFSKKLNDLARLEAFSLEEYKNHHREGAYSITQFDNEFMRHLMRTKRL